MTINLLPSEEKSKVKKQKRYSIKQIELIYPEKAEKKTPGIKKAGVLTFFKQAFQKPKKEVVKKEEKKKIPEKKVIFEEKIIYQKEAKPKISYYKPPPEDDKKFKPKSTKPKTRGFFARLFGTAEKQSQEKVTRPAFSVEEKEAFPKYKPVKAEKVLPTAKVKPRNGDVIKVVTKEERPAPKEGKAVEEKDELEAAKKIRLSADKFPRSEPSIKATREVIVKEKLGEKKKTLWQRLINWLGGLFRARTKPIEIKKEPEKVVEKPVLPAPPLKAEPPIVFQQDKLVTTEEQARPQPEKPPLEKIKEEFVPPKREIPVPSFMPTPVTPQFKEKTPEPVPERKLDKPPVAEKKEEAKEPEQKAPKFESKPEKISAPSFIKTTEEKKKKAGGIFSWLAGLWLAVRGLFQGKSGQYKPKVPDKKTLAPDERIFEKEQALEKEEPALKEEEDKKDSLHKKEEKGVKMTQPKEVFTQPEGLDWEINLVPEEAMERKVPTTSWLYLILFVILACGLVFGAWIGVNWYYNTITTKISEVNQQIANAELFINSYSDMRQNVKALDDKISNVRTLLDKHIYWSEIFNKLEEYTIADIYYTGLTADINGAVSLTAIGKNYESAIKQLMVYQGASDFVTSVAISDININNTRRTGTEAEEAADESVTFSLELLIQPGIFYYQN